MDFYSAIKEIVNGRMVRRDTWLELKAHCYMAGKLLKIKKQDGVTYDWIISEEDILATDWIVYKEIN